MAKPFIATAPIFIGFARAHNVGDEVPESNVKANGWEHLVSRLGTKAASDALAAAGQPEPVEPEGNLPPQP